MANRLETHAYYDGEKWSIYSERAADIRRFTEWFGEPTRRGRQGEVAHWDSLPKDAVRLRRNGHRPSRKPAPSVFHAANEAGMARKATARSGADGLA